MRWAAVAVVALVAACDGTGLDIDIFVPSGTTVDRVEVWVAYDQCADCPNGVGWNMDARATGDIFFLRDERLIPAKRQDGRWVLHLDAAPGYADPRRITIVGFQGQLVTAVKAIHDPHVPVARVAIWQVFLDPAGMATTDLVTRPADPKLDHRAHVWARAPLADLPDPTGCLVYQQWNGSTWDTEYLVPKNDPDCDGFPPEKECNEFWYQYKAQTSTCVTDQLLSSNTCTLGAASCADGVTSDRTCRGVSSVPVCLPDGFCQYCMDDLRADTCIAGAIVQGDNAGTMVHYHCYFDTPANLLPCAEQHVQLQVPVGTNTFCGTPMMHYIDQPFTAPQPILAYGSGASTLKLEVRPSAAATPCTFDIYWTAGPADTFGDQITFLLDVPYDNGTRAMFPIIVGTTANTISCAMLPVLVNLCTVAGDLDNDGVSRCGRGGP